MAMQKLDCGEEEEPQAEQSGEDAQDQDGGAAIVSGMGGGRHGGGARSILQTEARAERGDRDEGKANQQAGEDQRHFLHVTPR